jgi:hypothetical protein
VTKPWQAGIELGHRSPVNNYANEFRVKPSESPPALCRHLGEVVDTKFLYAFRESGCIYQPVYVGKRCDIPASECTTDQLKYKGGVGTVEAAA